MADRRVTGFGLMWNAKTNAGVVSLNLDEDRQPEEVGQVQAAEFVAMALLLQQPAQCVYDSDKKTLRTAWVEKEP